MALAVVVIALALGWSDTRVKSRFGRVALWIGAIFTLLAMRFFDGHPFEVLGLAILFLLDGIRHIPSWVAWILVALVIAWFARLILSLIGNSFAEVLKEIEKANSRLQLLDNSITDKLNSIQRRLPEDD